MFKKTLLITSLIAMLSPAMQGQLQKLNPNRNASQPKSFVWTATPNQSPAYETVEQGFEGYTDFTLNFSPWSTADIDGSETYIIENHTFANQGTAMSYIVFNPANVVPSLGADAALQPHSGNKFAACFASTAPPNNDWLITPLIQLGSNSTLSFWVKSYTSQYGLERYKIGISTTNNDPSSFTFISGSGYLEAPAAAWQQKEFNLSAYDGQQVYIGFQCVSNDAFIFMLDDIVVNSETATGGTLTGKVTDAVTGNPIPDALVSVAGLTDYTDSNGNYSITGIPAGTLNANFTATPTSGAAPLAVTFSDLSSEGSQTVTASRTGYVSYSNSQVVIPDGGSLDLSIALSPTLATGQMRFVLSWGELPLDLDSHLKTPSIDGNTYHVYYGEQGSADSPPYVILDIDDTQSYGPETTTIYDLYPGEYHYYIYNYSQEPAITSSGAVVQIFNDNGLINTLQIPTVGSGLYWDICTVNGNTGAVNIINSITSSEPGGKSMEIMPPKKPSEKPENSRNIISWNWNFGDGGTSTQQNPSHTYQANGSYNVSLTVSDGVNSKTETKNQYIQVGGGGGSTGTLTGKVTDAVTGNPIPDALVSVAGLTDYTDSNGNYSITGIPAGTLNANFTATPTSGAAPLAVLFSDLSSEGSQTVTASHTGYVSYSNSQVVIPEGGSLDLSIALSPTLATGQMRFVLSWGILPEDLDSHLKTPSIAGNTYHIYYGDQGSADSPPYVILDIDDTDSYGPETTTIYDLYPGEYHYYIENYSEDPEITTSGAVVQIFNDNGLINTLQIPTVGTGLYWDICTVNGSTGAVTIINTITQNEPGGKSMEVKPPKKPSSKPENSRNIVSWNWNFGDGGTSTQQNPSHTYQANGSYNVSLTVSDGVTSKTETKNQYIQVGPIGIDEQFSIKVNIYPNPVNSDLHITTEENMRNVKIYNINGQIIYNVDNEGTSLDLNLNHLAPGTYILVVTTEKGMKQIKFNKDK